MENKKMNLVKEIAELRAIMCFEAGCIKNCEINDFLEDDPKGLNIKRRLEQFFKRFEDNENGLNKIKRLNKVSKESLEKLKNLKIETEKLGVNKFLYLMDIDYNYFFQEKLINLKCEGGFKIHVTSSNNN